MLRAISLAFALFAASAPAAPPAAPPELVQLRRLSEARPTAALAEGHHLLDGGRYADEAAEQREILYWMGRAGLILSDDAAIAEVALRLDTLGQTRNDPAARAYAGFLRAHRLLQRGHARDGLAEALRAADLVQDSTQAQVLALADYSVCDAYIGMEEYERATPFCSNAGQRWGQAGDIYDEARAINLGAMISYNQNDYSGAIRRLEHARTLFRSIGEDSMVVSIGDNLARLYIHEGRAAEALPLSRAAYQQDRANGRAASALLSRANIARALGALGRHREAMAEIAADITDARRLGSADVLPDLLDTQSRIAEKGGDLRLALKALRESDDLDQNPPKPQAQATPIAELEAHYAEREKEMQIRELDRANRIKQLELTAAHAQSAEREATLARQRDILVGGTAALVALGAIAALLFRLLRVQRRLAGELAKQVLLDPLTGVENRRGLFRRMNRLKEGRESPPHALLLLDLDHFKAVNDHHGHPAGDAVLSAVAKHLTAVLDGYGTLARPGGEEFTAVCPGCDRAAAMALAERLRTAVAALDISAIAPATRVTTSVGIAVFNGKGSVDDWMRAADRALYAAKARGRNCTVEASSVRLDVAAA